MIFCIFTAFVNEMEDMMLNTFHNKSNIDTTAALEEAKRILEEIKGSGDFKTDEEMAFEESRLVLELIFILCQICCTNTDEFQC